MEEKGLKDLRRAFSLKGLLQMDPYANPGRNRKRVAKVTSIGGSTLLFSNVLESLEDPLSKEAG